MTHYAIVYQHEQDVFLGNWHETQEEAICAGEDELRIEPKTQALGILSFTPRVPVGLPANGESTGITWQMLRERMEAVSWLNRTRRSPSGNSNNAKARCYLDGTPFIESKG